MSSYRVTKDGHNLDIGGQRRTEGELVVLNQNQADAEDLRGTIETTDVYDERQNRLQAEQAPAPATSKKDK